MSKENSETNSADMLAVYPVAEKAAGLLLSTLIIKLGKSSSVARGTSAGVGEAKAGRTASVARIYLKYIIVMFNKTLQRARWAGDFILTKRVNLGPGML
jgi:hypothetical protein